MEKYYNDAIIGNKEIVATLTKQGELIRILYPARDFRQFLDFFHTGIKVNDSNLIYLHKDVNNIYNQNYIEDTNIVKTTIFNTYFKLEIQQTDFVSVNENILVRKYEFFNRNSINLDLDFVVHSKLLTNNNNQTSGLFKSNALIQYAHDYTFSTFSKQDIQTSQINNNVNIVEGNIYDKDYVGMSSDSSIKYKIKPVKPNEKVEFSLIININNNKNLNNTIDEVERIKKLDLDKEYETTKRYWNKYVAKHDLLNLKKEKKNELLNKIYKRTILLYPLLSNEKTGGISAAIEVDEDRKFCGRYSYCWPRDAVFITESMDILGMTKETEKFYKVFCKETQSKEGKWEQRFYTDGALAPAWGYQIDETASVIYGVYNHYIRTQDKKFLKDNLKMCEKANKYLKKYIDKILQGEDEEYKSYDIWEENEGIHTYSLGVIFAAFNSMIKIYETVKPDFEENRLKIEKIQKDLKETEKYLREIKEYILKNLYDVNRNVFVRNKDGKLDISLLGLVTPFNIFSAKENKITNTIKMMSLTLRTYTGGYLRYEGDNYKGGNPWVIATLWMAMYYIETKKYILAKECLAYVVNSATEHGFLAEQVNNNTMQPAWVIGLGWSHAMFIIVLEKLIKKGLIK